MSSYSPSVTKYTPRHKEKTFAEAYHPRDFSRQDERPDTEFYSRPILVTHIDDHAIESLSKYYDDVLPRTGTILDFCSSWVSHYPARIAEAVEKGDVVVYGMGLNADELARNPLFGEKEMMGRRIVQDLNDTAPVEVPLPFPPDVELDASTCTVSIDYLSRPLAVLTAIRKRTVEGGRIHLAISNRAFWHKVIGRWREVGEEERVLMVCDFLWFSAWKDVEVVTVVPQGGGSDPLWVVRGTKRTEEGDGRFEAAGSQGCKLR
ncbi:hypothetical protein FKW77_008791 [Venturia effusa]|uniref:Methyltransferase type 11 domain-containing protein n=1 Tax=Venturia effusa TaxID=50376 RepID=A0A517L1W4_9PEZI|nr:hypothetical protein FKW77_008791 [Venturia effusa]